MSKVGYVLLIILAMVSIGFAQTCKVYTGHRGEKISFPLGDLSFADEVISFKKGDPSADEQYSMPDQALGPPDYVSDNQVPPGYVTLGCEGSLVVRFVDNILVDINGPDLYIFEIGPNVEPTELSISKDGENWINVGKISGATSEIDLSKFVKSGDVFHYVRLTDLKSACGGSWPGADIDAIGAIGSAIQITLGASVLFDFDKYTLKPEAQKSLQEVASNIKKYQTPKITVEGHTDNIGSIDHNQKLSERRAAAVRDGLNTVSGLKNIKISTVGYGKSRPVASNDTEEGREKNRRVELIIVPQCK